MADQLRQTLRRRFVAGFVVIFAIWPLVQHQLVVHYRINPWNYGGWAMYSTVRPGVRIRLEGRAPGGVWERLRPRQSPEVRDTLRQFAADRMEIGLWADPDPMVSAQAGIDARHDQWRLTVEELGLTPDAHLDVVHRSTYEFTRTAAGVERSAFRSSATN